MYLFILAYLILFLSFFTYDERFNLPTNDILSEAQIPSIAASKLTGQLPADVETKISYNNLLNKPPAQAPPNLTGYATIVYVDAKTAEATARATAAISQAAAAATAAAAAAAAGGYKVNDSPTFGTVTCGSLNITSDRRIKKNIQPLVSLDLLRKLKPVRYQLKNGQKEVCGFIAQEILETIPDAVCTQKGVVANICDEATVDKDILTFSTFLTSDLSYDAEKKPYKLKVDEEKELVILEVLDEHRIRINKVLKNKVYVLGQEVPDLLSIDSHQIFTVATAAVQELDTKVQHLDTKVQQLEEENKALLERFNRLESLVSRTV